MFMIGWAQPKGYSSGVIKRGEVLAARGEIDDIVDLVPDYKE